jgi:hypothetical protein
MLKTKRTKSKRGNAESYDVYFSKFNKEKEKENLKKAIDSFKMRNRREPNKLEIHSLKQFITTSNKETSLIQFKLSQVDGDSDNEHDEEEKDEILEEVTAGLADTEVEKLKSLIEDVSYEGADEYKKKLTTIKESYFGVKKEANSSTENVDAQSNSEDGNTVTDMSDSMSRYTAAISRVKSRDIYNN